jgi:hypothetical protein
VDSYKLSALFTLSTYLNDSESLEEFSDDLNLLVKEKCIEYVPGPMHIDGNTHHLNMIKLQMPTLQYLGTRCSTPSLS